jgi:transcriptional regulator with XRE-family HTH domain
MSIFAQSLDEVINLFGYPNKKVAADAGIGETQLSEFRRGKRQLSTENLEKVIFALPIEARNYLFFKVLISGASDYDVSNLLSAIALELRKKPDVTQELVLS